MAIAETDLKRMLAYTTMASLGLLVMLTGLGLPHAAEAAVLYLVAHSLFKARSSWSPASSITRPARAT